MKKITSFLTLALLLGGVSSAAAQSQLVPELQGAKRITVLADPVLSEEDILSGEGWYVLSQSRDGEGYMFDVDTLKEASVKRYRKSVLYDDEAGAYTSTMGAALVRFFKDEETGTYKIMFGTGRYISELENETNDSQNLTADIEDYAANLFVYVTETDGVVNEGCFALNFVNSAGEYGLMVDTNGMSGNSTGVVTWHLGKNTQATGNNIWSLYEVEVEDADDLDVAYAELGAILNEYGEKQGTFTGKTSTDNTPGTYSEELVAAFTAAMNDAFGMQIDYESYTAEELRAAGQAVIEAYNAAIATYADTKWNALEPGYYFIASHKMFTQTITPETPEVGEGEEQPEPAEPYTIVMNKYMYSDSQPDGIQAKWGTIAEDETKAIYLWKVEKKDDYKYLVKNVGTDAGFCQALPAMSVESDSLIQFDYAQKKAAAEGSEESDTIFFNLRHVAEAGNTGNSFHANNHASGAGTGGTVIKWNGGAEASQWAMIPVSEADAQAMIDAYAATKGDVELQNKVRKMIADAKPKMEIALDHVGLITSVDQLSSPYTETPGNEPGSGLEMLLDGDKNGTYWHSMWAGSLNNVETGHYLQVMLNSTDVEEAVLEIGRRSSAGYDHPTEFEVYGTDDPDAEKTSCDILATVAVPFGTNTEVVKTESFPIGGYQYLRFYATNAHPNFRTYWHAGYFQLFDAAGAENPTSQAVGMGEIFTNLQTAIEAAEADGDTITVDHCNALIAAYEAFSARYVNPDTLRTAISANKNVPAIVAVGTQPGMWPNETTAQALTKAIEDATAYDKAGVYYPAQSAGHVKAIADAKEAFLGAANKVNTGKWYNFRFATEEMYDQNNWSKTGADAHLYSVEDGDEFVDEIHWPSLFGKLVSVGKEITTTTDSNFNYLPVTEDDTVAMGNRLFFVEGVEIDESNADQAKFRFINSGDTAYIIQNKATGLYLRAGGSGAVTLSIQPSIWKNTPMGYGKLMSKGNDILGNNNNYLHAQRDINMLVTWNATDASSNTGFLIEEVEDVDANYAKNDFQMVLMPNAIYGMCYPMDITPAEDQKVYGVEKIEGEAITLQVYKDNKVPAGMPFIYITGTEEYDAEAQDELHSFTYGGELNVVADTTKVLRGSYAAVSAPRGSIIATGEGSFKAVRSNTNIGTNGAWINAQIENPREANVTYTIAAGEYDSIKSAVADAIKGGKIYTIDGTYVGKGNIDSVKGLKKGLYIVNGVKVLVK